MTVAQKKTEKRTLWFVLFSLLKKDQNRTCREWVNTLWYGSPVLETYWSWTIRYQAWALFSLGRSCRSVGKGVQHKTTVHVGCITLIAHRTSDTEKKNILSVLEKSPLKLSPLKSVAFTIKLTTNVIFPNTFQPVLVKYTHALCSQWL